MSSIVPMGLVVSVSLDAGVEVREKLAENCPRCAPFAVDWRRLKARHSERAGYVLDDRQGQLELPRNVPWNPGVLCAAGLGPSPSGGERVLTRLGSGTDTDRPGSTWFRPGFTRFRPGSTWF
ncbi:hypothetical protein GCM10010230_35440 [Streptomyces narbonensis]|nr:hypothetical protein GCM10010230_35440 [Streptomyces narbonensis]